MIHGHELSGGGILEGEGVQVQDKGEKKWDKYNSIINKIYLKIEKEDQNYEH